MEHFCGLNANEELGVEIGTPWEHRMIQDPRISAAQGSKKDDQIF